MDLVSWKANFHLAERSVPFAWRPAYLQDLFLKAMLDLRDNFDHRVELDLFVTRLRKYWSLHGIILFLFHLFKNKNKISRKECQCSTVTVFLELNFSVKVLIFLFLDTDPFESLQSDPDPNAMSKKKIKYARTLFFKDVKEKIRIIFTPF
jgi:hypothetical protein